MTVPYAIKAGDLEPPIDATLLQATGTPVDLTTAASVRCLVRRTGATSLAVDRDATINSPRTAGSVTLAWQAGETDTPGTYQLEFEITWPGSRKQTVPAWPAYTFVIYPDLN